MCADASDWLLILQRTVQLRIHWTDVQFGGTHSLVITPLIPGAFFLDFITVQSPTAFFLRKANVAPPPSLTSSIGISPTFTQPLSPTVSGSGMPLLMGCARELLPVSALQVLFAYPLSGSRSMREAAVSLGTTAQTGRSDSPSRSVTPFTVYRDAEPSGSTGTGESQPSMVRTNQGKPRKGQRRAEAMVRVEEQEAAMTAPPAHTDR
ncbi:hypothetical protein B0H17DRAFT_1138291 [Mycena rosella]|uniref:Uncharacterized protein n=1 Tax=Mycena rosella TaxID=1033263 RepID=A0AAD7GA17_MYCRO|nr:hypothetical protein B0H17DRAFT_1138291 [Mycena rosella]